MRNKHALQKPRACLGFPILKFVKKDMSIDILKNTDNKSLLPPNLLEVHLYV